jgi:hypothetical protein
VLEVGVRDVEELIGPVRERDDGLPLRRIDHAVRPKAADAHGRELIEETPLISIGAAFGHTLRLRLACGKRKARFSAVP